MTLMNSDAPVEAGPAPSRWRRVDRAAGAAADVLIAGSLGLARIVAVGLAVLVVLFGFFYVVDAIDVSSPEDIERFQPQISAEPPPGCDEDDVTTYAAPLTGQPVYVGGC